MNNCSHSFGTASWMLAKGLLNAKCSIGCLKNSSQTGYDCKQNGCKAKKMQKQCSVLLAMLKAENVCTYLAQCSS